MNSTELHEAYLGIYNNYLIEGKKKKIKQIKQTAEYYLAGYEHSTGIPPGEIPQEVQDRARQAAKQIVREDIYDLILDYLLDEGFASDLQSAQMIMSHMSIDWIDDIISEVRQNPATARPFDQTRTPLSTSKFLERPVSIENPDLRSTGRSGGLTPSGRKRVTNIASVDRSGSTDQGRTRRPTGQIWYVSGQNT